MKLVIFLDYILKGHVVRIISHNDADGLTSAGIFANAIKKQEVNSILQYYHVLETVMLKNLINPDINYLFSLIWEVEI